ncbi:MAG: hypothetical protein C0507_00195 [Cyanobacteria bacterium PR.3.49]|nr:hypothetical protein [Cyanobacteria bacterium PR.3.49]
MAFWKNHSLSVVKKGNLAKFSAHLKFAAWLLNTALKVLVEASMWDRIWGIGMMASAAVVHDPKV